MTRRFLSISCALVLAAMALSPGVAARQGHSMKHSGAAGEHGRAVSVHPSQLASLRGATARFHRLEGALAEEYTAFGGCFSDPSEGGMGYHYVNDALVTDPEIDPLRPELLVYERRPNGQMQLVAVEYITFVSAWHAAGHTEPPSLFGQEFHINPTLLAEPFYLLHVWVWKNNPSGTLSDWNPTVRCP